MPLMLTPAGTPTTAWPSTVYETWVTVKLLLSPSVAFATRLVVNALLPSATVCVKGPETTGMWLTWISRLLETTEVLPAASVAVAFKVLSPSDKPVTVAVNTPEVLASPSATTSPAELVTTTWLPASAETEIVCVVLLA